MSVSLTHVGIKIALKGIDTRMQFLQQGEGSSLSSPLGASQNCDTNAAVRQGLVHLS